MKKTRRKMYTGMSLIEVMAVIAIIGILASIITVSLSGARKNAKASSVLQSMTSVAPLAYKCLTRGTNSAKTLLNAGNSASNICSSTEGFANWPDIANTGWSYDNFSWCNVTNHNDCNNYQDGRCGGDWDNKKFCYRITDGTGNNCNNSDKCIQCTDQGCQKKGF
jgi:prepilin-type N-terminal cleavage/methylation domain-containing protein